MKLFKLALALALAALAVPAGAHAQSAIDQYIEHVPGAGGDKPSSKAEGGSGGDSGNGGGATSGSTIPSSSLHALEAAGADGVATAALAQATAPSLDEGVAFARALLARAVEAGAPLADRYDERAEAFKDLYAMLIEKGINPRVARIAVREFLNDYWTAPAPSVSSDFQQQDSAFSAVLEAFTGGGSGGMGAALPILLGAVLAALLAFVAIGRRSRAGR